MNYPRFNELFWEFAKFIEELHALCLDSVVGYELMHEKLEKHQENLHLLLNEHEYAAKELQYTCSIASPNPGH
jgi:hypothetical protein